MIEKSANMNRPSAPARSGQTFRPAVGLTTIAFCAEAAHTLLFIPLLQAYLPGHLHLAPAFPGYTLTAFATAKLVVQAPAGRLVDRAGTRVSASAGLALLLLSGALFALLRAPLLLLAVAALYGIGAAFLWPSLFTIVARRYGERRRGRLAAAIQAAEAAGVGAGVGIGSVLVDGAGYGAGFALYLALIGLALFALVAIGRPTVRDRSAQPAVAPRPRTVTRRLLLLAAIGAPLTFAPNLLTPIVRAYAVQDLHLQLHELVLPLIPVAAAGLLAMAASGAASDRIGRMPLVLGGLCAGAAGLWLLGNAQTLLAAAFAAALGAAGYLITQPAWSAAVLDASTEQNRGGQFGLMMVLQGLAEAAAPAVGGKVAELDGPGAAFRLASLVLGLAAVVALIALDEGRGERSARP